MNIYNYDDYKSYLSKLFKQKDKRGEQSRLAKFLNCQPGFISQVLNNDKTQFSLEHIEKIAKFLKLTEDQTEYLILLCLYSRAGSHDLKKIFIKKITEEKEKALSIHKRIEKRGQFLSDRDKAVYYSHWAYMAVHMLISIPGFRTEKSICKRLRLSPSFVQSIIEFLVNSDLIICEGKKFSIGKTRIHLNSDSPFVKSLHATWRNKAVSSLENKENDDLHYSSVLVLSSDDTKKIKEMILKLIKDKEDILKPSLEEEMVALNIDYFRL